MTKVRLDINKRVEILNEKYTFKSIIQDLEEKFYTINIPVNNGVYLPLQNDEEILVRYYEENIGCFEFNSKVIQKVIENNMHLYKVSKPYNVKKIQRRSFVRVNAVEYTFYQHLNEETEISWDKGLIVDLSGGGVRLKIKQKAFKGDKVLINLLIKEEKVQVKGKIVRVDKTEDKEYMCGVTFLDLTERDRDKIINKVFDLMRKQRGVL